MTGYVIAEKPEMKVKEYEVYTSYYCGVCKSIARRFGQVPRILLSYDSAFLALLFSGLSEDPAPFEQERCLYHPVKKRFVCLDAPAVDHAADVLLILAYAKLEDDIRDERKLTSAALKQFLKGAYRKLQKAHPDLCKEVEKQLQALSELEEAKSDSLDQTGEAFGKIMAAAFSSYPEADETQKMVLDRMGYALGRWMYLIDAFDDIGENLKDGNYNPLICRFSYHKETEDEAAFRERIRERVSFLLFSYLEEMSKAYDLLSLKKNRAIAENVVYLGLHRKTEEVLEKGKKEKEDERSL